jgi:hypothetical protein
VFRRAAGVAAAGAVGLGAYQVTAAPLDNIPPGTGGIFEISLMRKELAGLKIQALANFHSGKRYNTLLPSPEDPKYKLAVIEFSVPGAENGGSDKGTNGHRIDSIPIANGVVKTGNACKIIRYEHDKHEEFAEKIQELDAMIVRINPGQLSQGTTPGCQERFDALMEAQLAKGKLVWSSPKVQTALGAKDALVKINQMPIGLPDTYAYYSPEELEIGFKKCCAFQPRVIKQNRGSAGEGIWLCWLQGKEYCKNFGDASLSDSDTVKLMEMNDNHVEYHTVGEFLEFCVNGPTAKAGTWTSTFPGKYLEGGKAAGGQLVDQRLLPRIAEGEVRLLMVKDVLHMIIHKKPDGGGLSAVGGNSAYTYFGPDAPEYAGLVGNLNKAMGNLKAVLDITDEPLPLLWTADFIPMDGATPGSTEFVVGEFNCSCVGISKFQAQCGGSIEAVDDEGYFDACKLTDLMGQKAVEMLDEAKGI